MGNQRTIGLIKAVKDKGYGFLSSADFPERDIFVRAADCTSTPFEQLAPGLWAEFDVEETTKGLVAKRLGLHEATIDERIARGRSRYTGDMQAGQNPGSLRLDGLTMGEAKRMKEDYYLPRTEFFAYMSENGLQSAARHFGITYDPGSRLAVAEAIVREQNARQAIDG